VVQEHGWLGEREFLIAVGLAPFDIGLAYVNNMAHNRVGEVFGKNSNSLFATITLDYGSLLHNAE
jgi:hypothetical protein